MTAALGAVALLSACGADATEDAHPAHRAWSLPGKHVTIESDDSRLEIVSADVDKIDVTRWFKGKVAIGEKPRATWAMHGDRLTLRVHCSGIVVDCDAKHLVKVPRDVSVSVRGQDGSITATGFRTRLSIHNADGGVRVREARGSLDLRTEDGSIDAKDVRAHDISASSQDGSIHLATAVVPDRVRISAQDGSVDLRLPASAAYRVDTKTRDGSSDIGVRRSSTSTHRVTVQTEDGNVTVRTAN